MPYFNLGLSEVANIILSLLLIFQWHRDRSREDSVKNSLLGIREMVQRANALSSPDILTAIDSHLATLDVRFPYVERGRRLISGILTRFKRIETAPLSELSPIKRE